MGLSDAERRELQRAIQAAEKGHRGEIRVHLEPRFPGDGARARAEALFHSLGMDKTHEGTGVLLYVAELDRKTAVFAGPGIYGAGEPAFWSEVAEGIAKAYAAGNRVPGLVRAIDKIGDLLRKGAPGADRAGNELPDEVTTR